MAIFSTEGRLLTEWMQLGRPSGVNIDASDRLFVSDSQSTPTINPGFARGWRVGNARSSMPTSFSPLTGAAFTEQGGLENVGGNRAGDILAGRFANVYILRRKH